MAVDRVHAHNRRVLPSADGAGDSYTGQDGTARVHLSPLPHLAKLSGDLALALQPDPSDPLVAAHSGRRLQEGVPLPRRLLSKVSASTAVGVEVILAPGAAGDERGARALAERWLAELADTPTRWLDELADTPTRWLAELADTPAAAAHMRRWHFWAGEHRHARRLDAMGGHAVAQRGGWRALMTQFDKLGMAHVAVYVRNASAAVQRGGWRALMTNFDKAGDACDFLSVAVDASPRGHKFRLDLMELAKRDADGTCTAALVAYVSLQPHVYRLEAQHRAILLNNRDADWAQHRAILFNNRDADWVAQSGSLNLWPMWSAGILGAGEVIGMADSGVDSPVVSVDRRHCSFYDSDGIIVKASAWNAPVTDNTRRKIIQYIAYVDSEDEKNGHGTHVAGTLVGARDGTTAGSTITDGQAFEGKITVFDFGASDGTDSLSVPGDVQTMLLAPSYNAGARVHSNSWGTQSQIDVEMDTYVNDHQQMLIVIAAGNCGDVSNTSLDCGPEFTGPNSPSVFSPAQAKNVVAVGASYNYPNNVDGGDINTIAFFSARGPTVDGRIKPDVVGPGYSLTSASANTPGGGPSCASASRQGTSMATPVVAASAALVRQYFREGWYNSGGQAADEENFGFLPSAALLKAVLVNSAHAVNNVEQKPANARRSLLEKPANARRSLLKWKPANARRSLLERALSGDVAQAFGIGSYAPRGSARSLGLTALPGPPDKAQGHGRILLNMGVNVDATVGLFFKDWQQIAEGQVVEYNVTTVPTAVTTRLLSVTLVWTDPPSAPGAAKPVLHTLGVRVREQGSTVWTYPNGLAQADDVNNVQKVVLPSTKQGTMYIIEVSAPVVTESPTQYYALAAAGEFIVTNDPPPPPPADGGANDNLSNLFTETTGIKMTWQPRKGAAAAKASADAAEKCPECGVECSDVVKLVEHVQRKQQAQQDCC
ncbi:peptidase S8/S53 domain-containing protein [Tribonema minus]|uniref:subtilisin n=1 Tax=Tribonema minus TaxID=303371 RepID=A0A836CCI7_9STRA|nr:peptidase S8/S53 domain-containing protein [Tribonema minus]